MIERELKILPKIKHNNIVKYLGHDKIDLELYIYLEYLNKRSIKDYFSKGILKQLPKFKTFIK